MEYEEDEIGSNLVELYVAYVTSSVPISEEGTLIGEIESAVRSALGLPNNEVLTRHNHSETTETRMLAPRCHH
jgi:hypothetical protein